MTFSDFDMQTRTYEHDSKLEAPKFGLSKLVSVRLLYAWWCLTVRDFARWCSVPPHVHISLVLPHHKLFALGQERVSMGFRVRPPLATASVDVFGDQLQHSGGKLAILEFSVIDQAACKHFQYA